jgi:hypothetical protein
MLAAKDARKMRDIVEELISRTYERSGPRAGRLEAVRSLAAFAHDQRVVNRLSDVIHHGSTEFRLAAIKSLGGRTGFGG